MSKNSYAVFGLGSFGSTLAEELSAAGHTVLVCDIDENKVDEFCAKVAEAVVCDVANPDAVHELNVSKFDAVILGMSSFFEKQVLALTLLKQEGAKRIYAKANSDLQKKILSRLGADVVIQPEKASAEHLARQLGMENIKDFFEFKGSTIAEVLVPSELAGGTLRKLDLRNRHRITVLLLHKPDSDENELPGPDAVLEKGDVLTVFGKREDIENLFRKES